MDNLTERNIPEVIHSLGSALIESLRLYPLRFQNSYIRHSPQAPITVRLRFRQLHAPPRNSGMEKTN